MANDFFNNLSKNLSKTAKDAKKKVNIMYEVQKLQNRITGEEKSIEKVKSELGNLIFSKFEAGEVLGGDLTALCDQICSHLKAIDELKAEAADKKGQKICPGCKKSIDKMVAFCPYCGTACPVPEPEEEDYKEEELSAGVGEEIEEAAEEAFEAAEDAFAEAGEKLQETADAAEDFASDAADAAEEFVSDTADAAEEFVSDTAETLEEGFDAVSDAAEDALDAAADAAEKLTE